MLFNSQLLDSVALLLGSQVRVVTLEMLIILFKELVTHTVENKRHSYLNDRHLAMIEVFTSYWTIQCVVAWDIFTSLAVSSNKLLLSNYF